MGSRGNSKNKFSQIPWEGGRSLTLEVSNARTSQTALKEGPSGVGCRTLVGKRWKRGDLSASTESLLCTFAGRQCGIVGQAEVGEQRGEKVLHWE